MMTKTKSYILYILGFLLLWEWLRPLTAVTNTHRSDVFLLFAALCVLLSMLHLRWFITILVKLIAILIMLRMLYTAADLKAADWLTGFSLSLSHNISLLFQGKAALTTELFRTLLFFLVVWLICYLVYEQMLRKQRMLLFLFVTITYIAILDTFTPYSGRTAIIRLVIIGFLLLGLLQMERLKKGLPKERQRNLTKKLLIPLCACIAVSTACSYLLPKAAPQWPDPFPFLTTASNQDQEAANAQSVQRMGYGEDDSQLGGSILPDDTVVFKAQVQEAHYWRVETKDVYTGKGWELSDDTKRQAFGPDNTVLSWFEEGTKTEEANAFIFMEEVNRYVVYPAGLLSIEAEADVSYMTNIVSEKIFPVSSSSPGRLKEYELSYQIPEFSVEALQTVTTAGGLEENPAFVQQYTQLPATLPQRVRDLATELVQGKANRYDQVKAIESYLGSSDFTYSTVDIPIPKKNEDYVDQFLFETKIGYCNNFSTSMVVLLRSVGIPARWVKGYTDGTLNIATDTPEGMNEYVITNNNAHSWVEVYFPSYGWVTFEPTKGFINRTSFTTQNEESTSQETTESTAAPQTAATTAQETQAQQQENAAPVIASAQAASKLLASGTAFLLEIILVLVIILALILTRKIWLAWLFIARYRRQKEGAVYGKAYHALLRQLARAGLKREESQTLRDYAQIVDAYYESTDMQQLTLSYERARYQEGGTEAEWQQSIHIWEQMMKRTMKKPPSR